MLLMFERGISGDITQGVHCVAKATIKYMGEKYITDEDTSYLQYLYVNNLYGWTMAQDMPTDGFKF